jgi:predicted ATPase
MIVTSIGHAVDFQFHEAAEPQEQLLRYLRGKQMLLVLDNFEHLMEGVGLLPTILQAAPGIRLLVTSRERLNLQGEWALEVEGLPYPSEEASLEQVEAHEAVQLFLQSALRVHPTFSLNEENREWVAHLPVDGNATSASNPAAPGCERYPANCSGDRAQPGLSKLCSETRASMALRAPRITLNLLSLRKTVFRRLSVFRGGFRREAAQAVAGSSLEELTSLLDKSLLKRVGAERYDLHELVRQYADSHLQSEQQEDALTQELHSNYYASQLEGWGKKIASLRQMEAGRDGLRDRQCALA